MSQPRRRRPGAEPERAPARPEPVAPPPPRRAEAPPPPVTDEAPAARLDRDDLLALAQMDPAELAARMEGNLLQAKLEPGTKVVGRVARVGRDTVFVDLGGKSEGQLDRVEVPDAKVGQELGAFVVGEDENGVQ